MTAIISRCGQYRYMLERADAMTPTGPAALFVMLNPSTADATTDDPTIRRCRGFARAWGCAALVVANLYAYRATDPRELQRCDDPVGPLNDEWLRGLAREHGAVICAWGANAQPERVRQVVQILKDAGATLWCLGTTKAGAPRHPLYVRADQTLVPWEVRA